VLEKAAAGDPSDIFAVATEMFLAAPAMLQARQPALYNCMRLFYRVDPARWKTKP
jgi:Mlc titration factor MtfA (ptsG expression regulator)